MTTTDTFRTQLIAFRNQLARDGYDVTAPADRVLDEAVRLHEEEASQQARRAEEFRVYLVECNNREVEWRRSLQRQVGELRMSRHLITDDYLSTRAEVEKLRLAIRDAGFAVMQTSGRWSIHDVSELGKKEQERTNRVIAENVDLAQRVRDLEAGLRALGGATHCGSCSTPLRREVPSPGVEHWRCPSCGNPHWWPSVGAAPQPAPQPSEPHMPLTPCCVCGDPVCTYEWGECPDKREDHKNGAELTDGRWTCSESCFEKAAEPSEPASPTTPEEPRPQIVDLMESLKASLAKKGGPR